MALPFEPRCAPLLLGSLPLRNAHEALALERQFARELLAWPQLWRRGFREQFLAQSAAGFPGLVLDETSHQIYVSSTAAAEELGAFELAYLEDRRTAAQLAEYEAEGLHELLRQPNVLQGVRAIKGQMLGPVSFAMMLTDERERPLVYDPALLEAASQFIGLRLGWQEQRLAELGRPTIMCLDEPFLEMVNSPFLPIDWEDARTQIQIAVANVRGCRAIFAGGAVDWGHLLRLGVELVIGDVYEHGGMLVGAAETLATHISKGGMIGLGIVPAEGDALIETSADNLIERLEMLLAELRRSNIDSWQLLRRAVVTPNGALGSLHVEHAERALALLAETSTLLRERYKLQ